MTKITKRAMAPLIIGLTMACHPVLAASSPTGIWLDHTGRGAVEITDCGGAGARRVLRGFGSPYGTVQTVWR